MTQPLFFEPDVQFEKTAAEVMLPEDANEWPNELMQELFKQVPYIADFEPHVVMDRVDAERGYGFGHIEVQNKTEIQHGAPPDATAAAGIKNARIPVVIKDLRLQPLDLLVTDDSKVLPLTESRLRQAIFRPQAFDITGRGPGDMSMIGQLYPPYRQNYGFGGGGATMNVGMGKEGQITDVCVLEKDAATQRAIEAAAEAHDLALADGSSPHEAAIVFESKLAAFGLVKKGEAQKEALNASTLGSYLKKQTNPAALAGVSRSMLGRGAQLAAEGAPKAQKYIAGGTIAAQKATKLSSVLSAILPTIRTVDYDWFFQKFASDRGLQAQYIANHGATAEALATLSKYEPVSPIKLARAALSNIKPSVVQLRKEAQGYRLKTASHACWLPEEKLLNRGEAVHLLGGKVVLAADQTGSTTMSLGDGAAEGPAPAGGEAELVSEYGIYQVQDEKGNHLIGFVFPNLVDIDGTALPIALFTNGSQMAVQSDIAGIPVGEGVSLFEGHPEGTGVFYKDSQATIPLTVKATMAAPEEGGVILHGETFDGRGVQIMVQPNIAAPTPGPEGEFLIPDTWSWLPLDTAEKTALISSPEDLHKEGTALRSLASVTLRYGGDCFSVSGFPVEKLASEETDFLSLDDTLFLLAGLGTNLAYAQKKLGEAAAWNRPISVLVERDIKTAAEVMNESRKTASRVVQSMPHLRKDLVKEAAVIPDPSAVDTVLSLGFLNPENLGTFIGAIPEIDSSQMKMCELLLASRLGLAEVPSPALEKAIRSTEEVLEGLKILAFQK
jgi:hypothetical protein